MPQAVLDLTGGQLKVAVPEQPDVEMAPAPAPPTPKPKRSNRLAEGEEWRTLLERCYNEIMSRRTYKAHMVVDTVRHFYEDAKFTLLRDLMDKYARQRVVEACGEDAGKSFDEMDLRTRLYVLMLLSGGFCEEEHDESVYGLTSHNQVPYHEFTLRNQLKKRGASFIVRFARGSEDHDGAYFLPDMQCDKKLVCALIAHLVHKEVAARHVARLELRYSGLRDELCKPRPSFFSLMAAGFRASCLVPSARCQRYGDLQLKPELPDKLFGTHRLVLAFDDDHEDYEWDPLGDPGLDVLVARYCSVPDLVPVHKRRENTLAKVGGAVYGRGYSFCVHDRKRQRTGIYVEYTSREDAMPLVMPNARLCVVLRAAVLKHGAKPEVSWGDMDAFFAPCPETGNAQITTHSLHQLKLIYDHDTVVARAEDEKVEVCDTVFRPGVAEKLTELQRTTVQAAQWARDRPVAFDTSIELAAADGFYVRFTRGNQARLSRNPSPAPSRRSAFLLCNGTGSGKTLTSMVIHAQRRAGAWKPDLVVVTDGLVTHWADELRKQTKLEVAYGADVSKRVAKAEVVVCRGVKDLPGIGTPAAPPPPADLLGALLGAPKPEGKPATSRYGSRETAPRLTVVSHNFLRQPKSHGVLALVQWGTVFVEEAHELTPRTLQSLGDVRRDFTVCITATPYQNFKTLGRLSTGDDDYVLARLIRQRMHYRAIEAGRIKMELHEVLCENTPEEAAFFSDVNELIVEMYDSGRSDNIAQIFRMMERVTSGGRVHAELMLRRMRNIVRLAKTRKRERPEHDAPARARGGDVFETIKRATKHAHCDKSDECAVCCGDFDEPMQTNCGHVFCGACVRDVWDFGMRACPMCNRAMNKFYAPPLFRGEQLERAKPKAKPMEEAKPKPAEADDAFGVDNEQMDRKQFIGMLNPAAGDVPGVLTMRGKMNAFREAYAAWSGEGFTPQKQAIMFIQNDAAARSYAAVMREVSARASVGAAGLLGHNRAASLADIERFKRGELNVLMVSPRYCAGFDLANATEVWILGLTLEICQAVQAVGRVYRYSQAAAAVHIRVFLNPGTFGHYMWDNRHLGKFNMTRTTMLHYRIWHHLKMVPVARDAWRAPVGYVHDLMDQVICTAETLLGKPLSECIYITWRASLVLVDFKLLLDVKNSTVRVYGDTGRLVQFSNPVTFDDVRFNRLFRSERVHAADKVRALLAKAKVSDEHLKMMSQIEKARGGVV